MDGVVMNYIFAVAGAVLVGICVALEPTVNSGLGKVITPRLAAFHGFIVGTAVLAVVNLFAGGFKEYRLIVKTPPYLWVGGIIGVIVVYFGAKVVPVLGIASTLTIMVSVQMVTSIIIDTFGLLGVEKVPFDAGRLIGVILIIAAVKLIVR